MAAVEPDKAWWCTLYSTLYRAYSWLSDIYMVWWCTLYRAYSCQIYYMVWWCTLYRAYSCQIYYMVWWCTLYRAYSWLSDVYGLVVYTVQGIYLAVGCIWSGGVHCTGHIAVCQIYYMVWWCTLYKAYSWLSDILYGLVVYAVQGIYLAVRYI